MKKKTQRIIADLKATQFLAAQLLPAPSNDPGPGHLRNFLVASRQRGLMITNSDGRILATWELPDWLFPDPAPFGLEPKSQPGILSPEKP